jgi:hypothetical protein
MQFAADAEDYDKVSNYTYLSFSLISTLLYRLLKLWKQSKPSELFSNLLKLSLQLFGSVWSDYVICTSLRSFSIWLYVSRHPCIE